MGLARSFWHRLLEIGFFEPRCGFCGAEVSHQPTRQRERQMRRFKSAAHVQRFVSVHGVVDSTIQTSVTILCGAGAAGAVRTGIVTQRHTYRAQNCASSVPAFRLPSIAGARATSANWSGLASTSTSSPSSESTSSRSWSPNSTSPAGGLEAAAEGR